MGIYSMRHPVDWLLCLASIVAERACVYSLDNGVGVTPAMGYNTWDDFRCGGISADNVKKVADAFIKNGLDKVGYEYIGIDDCSNQQASSLRTRRLSPTA